MNNKKYSTLQLVLNGQLELLERQKLVEADIYVPAVKCMDTTQLYWQQQMDNQHEKIPLVNIGNSCTCSILLNTNYSS